MARKGSESTCIHFSSGDSEAVEAMALQVHTTLHLMRSGDVICRKKRPCCKSKAGVRVIQIKEFVYITRNLSIRLAVQLRTPIY